MRRWSLCVPLVLAVLASFVLVELWSVRPAQGAVEAAEISRAALLQPFETWSQGEGRLEKARKTLARKRSQSAAAEAALPALGAKLLRVTPGKKNASDRSLRQVGAAGSGAGEEARSRGRSNELPASADQTTAVGSSQASGPAAGHSSASQIVAACFSLWAQVTAAQRELQETIQLKWQANRQHDEAWFLADRLDRWRDLSGRLQAWFANHTQLTGASASGGEVQLDVLLRRAKERGIEITEETQHAWEEWHYINYYFPAGTEDAVRDELRTAEAESKQELEQREERLRTVADTHHRLKGRFAGECVGEGFPSFLLASIYSEDERRSWRARWATRQEPLGGSAKGAGDKEDAADRDAFPDTGGVEVEGQASSTRRDDRELGDPLKVEAADSMASGVESAMSRSGGERMDPEGQVSAAGAGPRWRVGREHWFLQRDLFPGGKNVSFILQYFKHPDNIAPLVAALQGCSAQMPGLTSEMLANVDNPDDVHLWMQARNASGDFLVPVFSHNIHEQRGYNRLARMATGAVLVFLQDDQLPPSDCSWLGDVLAAYAHYPQLGVVGLNTGVYSSKDTGWRMSALNGDNVYLRNSAINVDMQFVVEVDLAPFTMRRTAFDTVGGFNEAYSKPGEGAVFLDYELSIRAWLAGYQVAQVAMIPGMQQSGPSGTRSGKQLAIRMKNEGMNGADFNMRLSRFMPDIDKEVLRLNQELEPIYPDFPRPWEQEPPWRDSNVRPQTLPRFSLTRTAPTVVSNATDR